MKEIKLAWPVPFGRAGMTAARSIHSTAKQRINNLEECIFLVLRSGVPQLMLIAAIVALALIPANLPRSDLLYFIYSVTPAMRI